MLTDALEDVEEIPKENNLDRTSADEDYDSACDVYRYMQIFEGVRISEGFAMRYEK